MPRLSYIEQASYKSLPQVAQELGIHPETLRHYLVKGKLVKPLKNRSGTWLFTPEWIADARRALGREVHDAT